MQISVIIPVLNEEDFIVKTIRKVRRRSSEDLIREIIVVDGGSRDETISQAREEACTVVHSPTRSRPTQMNYGASLAKGDVLYFLHADSIPPENFDAQIVNKIEQGYPAGCFRLAFDYDHFLLRFYAWCTRFDIDLFRFGDQSLFIKRELFEKIGRFRSDHILMEDSEIVTRIKKEGPFSIINDEVTTSSRRYLDNGILKLQLVFSLIVVLYNLGVSQKKLTDLYKKLIR